MLGLLSRVGRVKSTRIFLLGPFNSSSQRRWRKAADSARTRLESRCRDLQLDGLACRMRKLEKVLVLREIISGRREQYASVQLLSRWKTGVDFRSGVGAFLRKYPHVFHMFVHELSGHMCCRMTQEMVDLIEEEERIVREEEPAAALRLKKLLSISTSGALNVHALWLSRRELGLPDDFRSSVILKNPGEFKLEDPEKVNLLAGEGEWQAAVERWREREHRERWLSEYETRYAFPVDFPTGFKMEKGFREKLGNWQRLQYAKPYEKMETVRVRSCGGQDRYEKRAVGIIHEFLSLTAEKMIEVERLSHFRKDFAMKVNVRELLLNHPGIFYISTKGNSQVVFLREAYRRGCLVEPNPVYSVRRRMMELISIGRRSAAGCSKPLTLVEGGESSDVSQRGGGWLVPILEKSLRS